MSVIEFPVRAVYRQMPAAGKEVTIERIISDPVVLILPVVRIDRDDDTPAPHRKRRGRDGE